MATFVHPPPIGFRAVSRVSSGTIGSDARGIGGTLLPLYANFAPDCDRFLKIAIE